MAKREILAGATDQTIDVFIRDSSSTTGGGLTGLAYNTASLTCYYRKGATGTPTALTLATQTVGGAHSDGGFVAVDGTNCPGQYRLDLSDTIVATAGMTYVYLKGATNMAPCVVEIEVVSVNKFDGVRGGMTALPNAAADAAGGLPISDAGGLDLDARLDAAITSRMATFTQPTGFLAATFPGTVASTTNITAGTITTVTNLTNAPPDSSGVTTLLSRIPSGIFTGITSLAQWLGLIAGKQVGDTTARTELRATGAGSGTFDEATDSVEALRDRGDAAWTTASGFATAAELAKVPKSDGTATWNATALASINAECDTALADYDAPTNAEMVARTLATADYATATDLGTVDTVVDAIKVKTDQFVFTVANQVDANALSGGGGLDAAGVRAAVGLASANLDTQLTAIDDYLDTEVSAIKAKTDLLTTFPANFSSLSIDSTGFVGANITTSGTAAAGTSSSITLAASASATGNYYVRQYVQIVSGTGAGQVRQVAAYTGSTKLVSVNFAWTTTPDNTSVYRIIAAHVPYVADNAGVTRAKDENDTSLATAANLNTVDDFLDTEVAAILAAVDTEVAAIKAKTDQLTFTVANQVDSNALSGGGSGASATDIRIEMDTNSTKLANLDATMSSRATPAQVATELATYDGPTNAEMVARTLASASYATATALGTTDTAVQTLTTRVGIPAVSVSDDLAAVKVDTGDLVTRITSTLFSGITSLAQMLGIMAGKQVGDTTARNELRATGAGSGTFDETTDSMQAVRDRGDAAWTTATGFAVPGDEMTLADSEDVYPADIGFTIDDTNSRDEYTVVWFRNGAPVTSGITVPTIQAIKRANGTDLIPSSVMTQIGSSGAYKYDAVTTERTTAGEAVVVVVSATINGSTRTWRKVITRDVEVVA